MSTVSSMPKKSYFAVVHIHPYFQAKSVITSVTSNGTKYTINAAHSDNGFVQRLVVPGFRIKLCSLFNAIMKFEVAIPSLLRERK